MKNKYTIHLLLLLCCLGISSIVAGQATLRVQGNVSSLSLSDCSDCNSSADPRINARIATSFKPWSGEYKNERDNVGCDGGLSSNPGTYDQTGVALAETWLVDIRGFESDGAICLGDDGDCNSYGGTVSGISGVILNTWAPSCGGAFNSFTAQRTCTSGGTQTYTAISNLRYHFDASTITDANAGGTIALSVSGDASLCSGANPSIINGNTLLNNRFNSRQWQVSINGGGFTDIGGETGQNYDPGVLNVSSTTTYTYRRRLAYCTDFSNGVTFAYSNSVTITVNPVPVATFTYASAAYCQNGSDPTPTATETGGTYTASPSGLAINSVNGAIDVSASTPGVYTVTHAYGSPCPASATQTVTINATGNSNFNYSASSYCQNGSDPTPTTSVLGGTFTSAPAGLSINASTGAIDVSASTANTYTITYNSGGLCPTTTQRSVVITPTDNATFAYGAISYCINGGTNPTPNVTGLGGGSFSSTPGLSINPSTGEIDLASSTAGGPYTVTYLTTGACPNTATFQVSITPAGNSTFSFAQAGYCQNASNPTPTIAVSGGSFAASAGLSINASTGQIDLASSTVGGPYTVTYTSTGACPTQSTFQVSVTPTDNSTFSYTTNTYCANGVNPTPTITGLGGGSFSASSGLFVNSSTGEISLSTSTVGGPYTVTYTTAGACPSSSTSQVSITPADNPAFSFTAPSYCQNSGNNPVANVSGTAGGTFTSAPAGLSINASTGEIDLVNSTVGTTYTITYTTPGTCAASANQTVAITGADNSTFAFADATICINGTNPTPTITGLTGGLFSANPVGLDINASTGLVDLSNSTVNTPFTVSYTTNGACPTTSTQSIVLVPAPVVSFSGLAADYCINAGTVALNGSPTGGTFSGLGVVGSTFNPTLTIAGQHPITYTYTDGNQCSNTSTQTVNINGLPFVSLSGLATSYCTDNNNPVALNILPTGGTLSGPGVSGTDFVPSNAGTGFITVTYTFTDANNCSNTSTQNTVVNALPTVGISGLANAYCIDANPASLTGIPNGGTFTGTGITGNTFDPADAGTGTFTITYSYTDGNSCSNTTTQNVTVNTQPSVGITGLASNYCEDEAPVNLIGTPPGGTFSGIGVSNNQLFPSIVGGNQTLVTYSYTDGLSCSNTTSQVVTINSLPAVSFSGLATEYCVSSSPVTLTGTPGLGTFSGPGISGTTFDPAAAGVGIHVITFAYTDGNLCSNTTTQTVVVNGTPNVAISNVAPAYCVNVTNVALTGIPAGGTFSGTGVTGNTFNPSVAGAGTYTLTYNYTDGNLCGGIATQQVTVNALPTPTISGLAAAYCEDATPVSLGGLPAGGTFNGLGISGNTFNPALAGAGTFTVTYAYTDGNGCSATASQSVAVNALPVVAFSGLNNSYCISNTTPQALVGAPAGGAFNGPGVSGTDFTPSLAGVGTHVVTYAYTDGNLCSNSVNQTVTVFNFPQVAITNLNAQYCITAGVQTLSGIPSGGTFGGPGVTGVSFDPAAAGVGIHDVTYAYSDLNGCSNTAIQQVQVYAQPTVTLTGLANTYCSNANSVTFTGTPSGGSFSGPGVSGNTFIPSLAGAGTHTITYAYSDGNGCSNTANQTVVVNAAPAPVLSGLATAYCINANPVTLNGTPGSGIFGGPGVSGNTFTPQVAGQGNHVITYSVTDGNNCTGTASTQVTVNPQPTVGFAGLLNNYCTSSPDVQMTAFPQGGSFTGTGVSGNVFSPSQAGPGVYTVTYTVTDANLCTNAYSQQVAVNVAPVVSFTGLSATYCEDASPIALVGTPSGGVFSGAGISGNNFDPSFAGAGVHPITYTYTTVNNCSGTSTQQVTVNATPSVQISNLNNTYCVNSTPVNLSGLPSGGTFTGAGVSGNVFTPANATVGQNIITYTFTDGNSCSGTTQAIVTVSPLDNATFFYNQGSYCATGLVNPAPTVSGTLGGTFSSTSGLAINASTGLITLANSTAGNYTVTYTTNGACPATSTFSVSITNGANAAFNYNNNQYCNNLSNPLPNIIGDFGGQFSGTSGLVINALTGEVDLANSATGTYTITYSVGGACPGSSTSSITITQADNAAFAYPLYSYCQSSTLTPLPTVNGNLGGTFSATNNLAISPVNGSIDLLASQQGVSTVTYTTNGVCPATFSQDIFINNGPVADITANGATTFCFGDAVLLDAGPGYFDYEWSTGVNTQIISATTSDNYIVTVTDSAGCSSSDTISVLVIQEPNASFTFNTFSLTANFSNLSDNGQSYLWIFGDGQPNSTDPNPVHTFPQDSTYFVTLVVTNICGVDSITIPVTVMKLGIGEEQVVTSFNIFPNPTEGNVTVNFVTKGSEDLAITLTDVTGRLVFSELLDNYSGSYTKDYNLNTLDRGVYLYSVRSVNGVITKRIVLN
jgi:hypothetical protein